jgi:hypothetical protein
MANLMQNDIYPWRNIGTIVALMIGIMEFRAAINKNIIISLPVESVAKCGYGPKKNELEIKIAKSRLSLLIEDGAPCFVRFMGYPEFNGVVRSVRRCGRNFSLKSEFDSLPDLSFEELKNI